MGERCRRRINIPGQYIGSVTTLIDPSTHSIINITQDDHLLSYGLAVRQVVVVGDGVFIRTIGVGNNTSAVLSVLNVAFSVAAFSQSISDRLRTVVAARFVVIQAWDVDSRGSRPSTWWEFVVG